MKHRGEVEKGGWHAAGASAVEKAAGPVGDALRQPLRGRLEVPQANQRHKLGPGSDPRGQHVHGLVDAGACHGEGLGLPHRPLRYQAGDAAQPLRPGLLRLGAFSTAG
eukprot:scaffold659827_cov34-Prasinocladus_malaysianus.AAC.1